VLLADWISIVIIIKDISRLCLKLLEELRLNLLLLKSNSDRHLISYRILVLLHSAIELKPFLRGQLLFYVILNLVKRL